MQSWWAGLVWDVVSCWRWQWTHAAPISGMWLSYLHSHSVYAYICRHVLTRRAQGESRMLATCWGILSLPFLSKFGSNWGKACSWILPGDSQGLHGFPNADMVCSAWAVSWLNQARALPKSLLLFWKCTALPFLGAHWPSQACSP